ncbi:hypothetical protein OE749_00780 [Aestuariibacter sp. AA17]|uniref:Uncharacterized protein n=1 Tax=Fluctibacter corallii TaxID=2984329 RepID=A0ABT3A3H1_9ALTE|nr:hypothetical protein [Aestuariibacter sp. AA17]MCV2883227.1 hypothetical protein [Aestuariibacter sp. AA17]
MVGNNQMANKTLPFKIYPDKNLVVVTAEGVVTPYEIYRHLLLVMEAPDFKMGMNAFYDLRRVERLIGDVDIIERTAQYVSDNSRISMPAKTAIVIPADNDNVKNVSKRFVQMARDSLMDYCVFDANALEDALTYLGISSLPVE